MKYETEYRIDERTSTALESRTQSGIKSETELM